MAVTLDGEAIRGILPHRGASLLIDSAVVNGDTARATIRAGDKVQSMAIPQLLFVEALAQLAGVALAAGRGRAAAAAAGFVAELVGFTFGEVPASGAEVALVAEVALRFGALSRFDVAASVAGKEFVRGSLTLFIEVGAGP